MMRLRHNVLRLMAAALMATGGGSALARQSEAGPTITVHGGAGDGAGSLAILEFDGSRWMIDCGMFYPSGPGSAEEREDRARFGNASLPVEPGEIEAVFQTHAHLDHIGRTPLLVSSGYQGPIYVTPAPATLAGPMLTMQVRLDQARERPWVYSARPRSGPHVRPIAAHWRDDCHWVGQINPEYRREHAGAMPSLREAIAQDRRFADLGVNPCRTCVGHEVEQVIALFREIEYHEGVELSGGVVAHFQSAEHIPGSASVVFTREVDDDLMRWTVVFSGDLGNEMSPLYDDPPPAPPADAVVVETTYGNVIRGGDHEAERKAFRKAVAAAVEREGIVLIPAFALDRTQKILYEMTLAKREGLIAPDVPILSPSPTGTEFTRMYVRHRRDGWFADEVADDAGAFAPPGLIDGRRAAEMIDGEIPRPAIIVTTSGMLTDAYAARLLPRLAGDARNAIFLVGYQDAQTMGRRLKDGLEFVETDEGERVEVRAEVRSFGCFSGHGDAREILAWLRNVRRDAMIVLVHGGEEELATRAEQLHEEGFTNVVIARPGVALRVPIRAAAP